MVTNGPGDHAVDQVTPVREPETAERADPKLYVVPGVRPSMIAGLVLGDRLAEGSLEIQGE